MFFKAMNGEEQYLANLKRIKNEGVLKPNRTGVDTVALFHTVVEHDMSEGFPLLTTKKIAKKTMAVELEGFINAVTDKSWYQERKCNIWNEWANPESLGDYSNDKEKFKAMEDSNDLGPIYGYQWRQFNKPYEGPQTSPSEDRDPESDQLALIVDSLKNNPGDRRMIVSAWNPGQKHLMALPPCHYSFQVNVMGDKLNLVWNQRSCDYFLGVPFNIASYGLLLHLLSEESGIEPGRLVGNFEDSHIYLNHFDAVEEQLSRTPGVLPDVETRDFTSIFDWTHDQTSFLGYKPQASIKAVVAV